MGLAAPLALLGLLGIALPIAAHLLRRRDVPSRPLPTIALLRRAEADSQRRVRIVDPLLLAARIALVAVAALAVAGPYLEEELAWGDGRVASVAIVIDDSMSMSRRAAPGTALDRALGRADEIVSALPQGSEIAIVLGGEPARLALPRTAELGRARARFAELGPGGARGTALAAAVQLAGRQLAGARHPVRRIVVLSDVSGALPADPGGDIAFEVERLEGEAPNLALTEALATPDPTAPDQAVVSVEVRAFGDGRARVPVEIARGGAVVARGEVALGPSGGRAVLRVPAGTGSDPTASVRLVLDPPDALGADDARGLLLRPSSAPQVLLVDGDPGRRHAGGTGATRFLAAALTLGPTAGGSMAVRTVDEDAFATGGAADADVVVLADVDPGAALRQRLAEHVARGGGVWIAGGSRVQADASWGIPLPARIVSVAEGESVGMARGAPSDLLPEGPTGLEAVRSWRRLVLSPEPEARVALAWSDGSPALVLSEARAAVLGTGLDDSTGDLPYRPGFLPLVVRTVEALAPPGAMPDAPFAPGHAPALRIPPGTLAVELVAPSGRVDERSGAAVAPSIDPSDCVEPGAWRVRMTDAQGTREAPRSAFVVAPPTSESDLGPADRGPGEERGPARAGVERTAVRRSLAPWLFGLVGILAVAEAMLRLTRRRLPAGQLGRA